MDVSQQKDPRAFELEDFVQQRVFLSLAKLQLHTPYHPHFKESSFPRELLAFFFGLRKGDTKE